MTHRPAVGELSLAKVGFSLRRMAHILLCIVLGSRVASATSTRRAGISGRLVYEPTGGNNVTNLRTAVPLE